MKRSGTVKSSPKKTTLDNTSFRLYDVKPTMDPSTTLKVKAEKGTQSTIALIGRQGGEPGVIDEDVKYLPKGGNGHGDARRTRERSPGSPRSSPTSTAAASAPTSKGRRIYSSDGSGYKFSLGG